MKLKPPLCFNPTGFSPIPPLCNRVGTEWGSQPADCSCKDAWPGFYAAALASGQAVRVASADCYDGIITMRPGEKPCASYRRPGGHNNKERWWYNAILEGLGQITDRAGHSQIVALVN